MGKRKTNEYNLDGEYGIGYCSNTGNEFYFDLEDYDLIKDYCWFEHADTNNYHVLRTRDPKTKKHITMHVLLGYKNHDHIDRNPLNNRKTNLRKATHIENTRNRSLPSHNTSGVIGVTWHCRDFHWKSRITINSQRINLGSFVNKEDAIKTRLTAELKYYGKFAPQKHLFEQYEITN